MINHNDYHPIQIETGMPTEIVEGQQAGTETPGVEIEMPTETPELRDRR